MVINQERYTSTYPNENANDTTWYIPYNFVTSTNLTFEQTSATHWLSPDAVNTTVDVKLGADEWILFNKEQTGYYRVLYDDENYKLITKELNSGDLSVIPAITRSQIANDLYDFVQTGRVEPEIFLNLIKYLKNETSYAPWVSAANAFSYMDNVLAGSPEHESFRQFVEQLAGELYSKISLTVNVDKELSDEELTAIATNLACAFANENCLSQTNAELVELLNNGNFESQYNRAAIYANGARTANEGDLQKLWNRFTESKNQDERREILVALGKTHNATLLNQAMDRVFADSDNFEFTSDERFILIDEIARNTNAAGSLVIERLSQDLPGATKHLKNLSELLVNLAERVASHEDRAKVIYQQ